MFIKSDLDLPSIDDSVDVTSSHAIGCCFVSTSSTLWTRPHVMNIDQSVGISRLFAMTLSNFDDCQPPIDRNAIIENKWENHMLINL